MTSLLVSPIMPPSLSGIPPSIHTSCKAGTARCGSSASQLVVELAGEALFSLAFFSFTHVRSVGEDRVEYALLGCIWSWASVLGCISRSLWGDMSISSNPNLRPRQLRTCVVADSLWRAP